MDRIYLIGSEYFKYHFLNPVAAREEFLRAYISGWLSGSLFVDNYFQYEMSYPVYAVSYAVILRWIISRGFFFRPHYHFRGNDHLSFMTVLGLESLIPKNYYATATATSHRVSKDIDKWTFPYWGI